MSDVTLVAIAEGFAKYHTENTGNVYYYMRGFLDALYFAGKLTEEEYDQEMKENSDRLKYYTGVVFHEYADSQNLDFDLDFE